MYVLYIRTIHLVLGTRAPSSALLLYIPTYYIPYFLCGGRSVDDLLVPCDPATVHTASLVQYINITRVSYSMYLLCPVYVLQ